MVRAGGISAWGDVLYNEADPITLVIELAADRRHEVLAGYRV
jgi:hypothetical protein